jgi:Iron-containing redox enzyme
MAMSVRSRIEMIFARQVAELIGCREFQAVETGEVARANYDLLIEHVVRAHLLSPQLVAFLYALAPPAVADALRDNLLEELGRDEAGGMPHPALLRRLAESAGLADRLPTLQAAAAADIRRIVAEPLLYGTLRELGLAALGEIVAFEYMLSRVAGRIAGALGRHRGLAPAALEWFTHHSEVDVRHAEQGLDTLEAYIRYYEIPEGDALAILEMTLRENVFIKRYFGERALARAAGMLAS